MRLPFTSKTRTRHTDVQSRLQPFEEWRAEAKRVIDPIHRQWDKWDDYFDPDAQHQKVESWVKDPALKADVITVNLVFSMAETYVSTLAQGIGEFYVVADDGSQDDQADILTAYLQAHKRKTNAVDEYQQAFREAILYGTGAVKVWWDHASDDVKVTVIDTRSIWPDPAARRFSDMEYCFIRNVYSKEHCERLFPGFDEDLATPVHYTETEDIEQSQVQPVQYEVWECYYDAGKKLIIYSGNQIIFEGDNPMPSGRFPVFLFQMHKRPRSFWTDSLIAYLKDTQDDYNKGRTSAAIHRHLSVHPTIKTTDRSLKAEVAPGSIWQLKPETDASYVVPPPLSAEVWEGLSLDKGDFDTLSGVHEVTRGVRPKGVTTGIAIESLQAAAQTRLAGAAMAWQQTIQDVGQAVLDYMGWGYSEPRTIASATMSGARRITATPDLFSTTTLGTNGDTGETEVQTQNHKYHVVTQQGGDLPLSKSAEAQLAIQLAQLGAIDQQALLEAVKFQGRDGVMQRKQQQEQAAVQGQQQAMQAQMQGSNPQQFGPPPQAESLPTA